VYRPYTRAPFDTARCTACGECFRQCPVLRLPPAQAKEEIERLRALADHGPQTMDHGLSAVLRRPSSMVHDPSSIVRRPSSVIPRPSSVVLRRCTSCQACNQVCPEDCRPANLILDLWHAAYLQEGLPARAAWFLPHARPNFRTYILDRLPQEERETMNGWRHGGPAREFLYAGCNLITTPYLTYSRLFEGLEIRGGLDYCCGEMLFRMGLYESVEQVARRLTFWFRRLGAERVYLVCTAGLNLLRNILPQFGADFAGIEFLPFQQVILERLRGGDLQPGRPPYPTVTVQDSCHARSVAPGFSDLPRHVLEAIGVRVREAPGSREGQLCCGIGGGFSHASTYNPFSLLLSARHTSRDHRRVPADATCVYCSGCLEMMSVARFADPNRRPVLHLLEMVEWAIGEAPRRRQATLAWQFLAGTLRNQFPKLPSRKRFWLPEISPEPNPVEAR
jgi:Fe-S oxidoreductase